MMQRRGEDKREEKERMYLDIFLRIAYFFICCETLLFVFYLESDCWQAVIDMP